jgi:hypothetical protein
VASSSLMTSTSLRMRAVVASGVQVGRPGVGPVVGLTVVTGYSSGPTGGPVLRLCLATVGLLSLVGSSAVSLARGVIGLIGLIRLDKLDTVGGVTSIDRLDIDLDSPHSPISPISAITPPARLIGLDEQHGWIMVG